MRSINLITLVLFLPWLPTAWDQVTNWPRTGVDLALDEQLRTVFGWITYGNTAGECRVAALCFPGAADRGGAVAGSPDAAAAVRLARRRAAGLGRSRDRGAVRVRRIP